MKSILFVFFLIFIGACTQNKKQNLYLGAPYMEHPLGEGAHAPYSPQPLVREDGFDCTTYVETLLAQRKARLHGGAWQEHLTQLRYTDGNIDFFSRAHFMEYQWIPHALQKGFITPIQGHDSRLSPLDINMQQWFLTHSHVHTKDDEYKTKALKQPTHARTNIAYIPTEAITSNFLRALPQESVVFFFKKLSKDTDTGLQQGDIFITHMGFLQQQTLYHASIKYKKIQKIDLLEYLHSRPQFIGVSFYAVR